MKGQIWPLGRMLDTLVLVLVVCHALAQLLKNTAEKLVPYHQLNTMTTSLTLNLFSFVYISSTLKKVKLLLSRGRISH